MKLVTALLAAFLIAASAFAQTEKNYVTSFDDTKVGLYVGIGTRYTTSLNSDAAGFGDIKGAVVFNGKWAVGLMSSVLYYDTRLSGLINDGTYHLNVAYGGLFVERIFSINDNFKLSLSIATGMGEASYRYDKDYRKEKVWSEEIIDKTEFAIFEPGIELQHRIAGNWWIGISGAYRNTSPLELKGTDENLLRKFSGGVTVKWGIF